MNVRLNDKAVAAIEDILRKGNKAVIQRSQGGVIVMEEKRKILYRDTDSSGSQERAI